MQLNNISVDRTFARGCWLTWLQDCDGAGHEGQERFADDKQRVEVG